MSKALHSIGILAALGAVVYTAVHFATESSARPNGPRKEKKPLGLSLEDRLATPQPTSVEQSSGWTVMLKKKAEKDLKELPKYLKDKSLAIIESLSINPFAPTNSFEKLVNKGPNIYSKRVNLGERIIYEVDLDEKIVSVIRARGHEYDRVNGIDEDDND